MISLDESWPSRRSDSAIRRSRCAARLPAPEHSEQPLDHRLQRPGARLAKIIPGSPGPPTPATNQLN